MSEPRKPLDLGGIRQRNALAVCGEQRTIESLLDVGPLCDEVEALRKALRDRLHRRGCACGMCHKARALLGEEANNAAH